jgi:hypothetical protein
MGAIWLGRWHVTQLLNTIAATSLLNVGVEAAGSAAMLTPAVIATTNTAVPKTNRTDVIVELLCISLVSAPLSPKSILQQRGLEINV